jgi:glycosyltransferase 2 family protein
LNGAGFVLIVSSMMTISPDMYIGLGATYILASIIGLLAIFVPGGLGVREAIIVLVLSVYFPVEQAIIVALVARFYATISDLGVGLVYLILNKGKIKQQ